MFNGIIFNKGSVTKILKRPKGINIFVKSDLKLKNKGKLTKSRKVKIIKKLQEILNGEFDYEEG